MSSKKSLPFTGWCHICGLMIPNDIVSPDHHLYGTVDHVTPRSKGGRESFDNRLPAHRICNIIKGNKDIQTIDRNALMGNVNQLLAKYGHKCSHQMLAVARKRVGLAPKKGTNTFFFYQYSRWDDDGGCVGTVEKEEESHRRERSWN